MKLYAELAFSVSLRSPSFPGTPGETMRLEGGCPQPPGRMRTSALQKNEIGLPAWFTVDGDCRAATIVFMALESDD